MIIPAWSAWRVAGTLGAAFATGLGAHALVHGDDAGPSAGRRAEALAAASGSVRATAPALPDVAVPPVARVAPLRAAADVPRVIAPAGTPGTASAAPTPVAPRAAATPAPPSPAPAVTAAPAPAPAVTSTPPAPRPQATTPPAATPAPTFDSSG
jgi:hypothetical protein